MGKAWGNYISTSSGNQWTAGVEVNQTGIDNEKVYFNVKGLVWTKWRFDVYANGSVGDTGGSASRSYNGSLDQGINATTTFASYDDWFERRKAERTITFKARYQVTGGWGNGTSTAQISVKVPPKPSYSIRFNANGGTGAPGTQTKWYGENLTLPSATPTRTGHSFLGWATSSGGGVAYKPGATYTANKAATLYAVWKANTYTVAYNANSGTGAPAAQTKTYGVTLKLSSTIPTKTNYNFKGWGTSRASTTVAYAAGANYTANAAITLFAVWELAYTAPRITNLAVNRCTSNGTLSDEGTYALIAFNWATDKNVSSIKIDHKKSTDSTWTSQTASGSGVSGKVSMVIGAGKLDTEYSYNVSITITDSLGSSNIVRDVPAMAYIIDISPGGKGIAFGKPSDKDGFEVNMQSYFDENVSFKKQVNFEAGLVLSNAAFASLGAASASDLESLRDSVSQLLSMQSVSVESSTTASQAYTAGDYVVVGGVLRKVTAAIAKGSTISDSNSTATTVTGELGRLDLEGPVLNVKFNKNDDNGHFEIWLNGDGFAKCLFFTDEFVGVYDANTRTSNQVYLS